MNKLNIKSHRQIYVQKKHVFTHFLMVLILVYILFYCKSTE